MGRKTLADLRRNPNDVSPAELVRVFVEFGWTVREGTKHGYVAKHVPTGSLFPFPRPHGGRVRDVYVRRAVKMIGEESGR